MAFSFVASEFIDSDTLNTLVINKPTGTVDDDIMFIIINRWSWWSPISVPSWWNSIWTQTNYYLYWKKASSEWSSYSWGFSWSTFTSMVLSTFRWWFDLSNPIDVVSNTVYTTSNTILRAAGMIVTYPNSPIIYLWTIFRTTGARTFTPPTSPATFTEHYDWWSVLWWWWFEIASMIRTWSWSTGDMDSTISWTIAIKHAFAVALKPELPANWNFLMFM